MPDAILVADDEPGVRESLAEVLRDAGYEVETAADGRAAIAALEGRDFALVVTDLRMPGADGLAVLRRAREISPQTLVLVMTADRKSTRLNSSHVRISYAVFCLK